MNQVILCIVESPFLDSWKARYAYCEAKAEERKLRMYEMDLLWLNVKRHYNNLPQPSEVANKRRITDNRSAKQIVADTLKKLKGG